MKSTSGGMSLRRVRRRYDRSLWERAHEYSVSGIGEDALSGGFAAGRGDGCACVARGARVCVGRLGLTRGCACVAARDSGFSDAVTGVPGACGSGGCVGNACV